MKMSSLLIIAGLLLVSMSVLAGCKQRTSNSQSVLRDSRKTSMKINDKNYEIELAITPEEHTQGLSDRTELGSDGMLFVFNYPVKPSFWMKDMNFDLDFIWIKDGTVTEITTHVKKPVGDEQLPTYQPQESVDMMLEVNAGFAESEGIKVGDNVFVLLEK